MKILIINEKLLLGGAEQSCLKMKKLLENENHNVHYLTFDENFEEKINKIDSKNNIYNIKVKGFLVNKMIFKPILYFQIRKIIKKINPDKIILNNIFCSPITQLKALKGYEVYQIIRDYTVICPKMTATKMNYQICKGYHYENCRKECTYHNSKLQLMLKLHLVKKMEKLRKKLVKKVISPSEKLNTYLKDYGYNSTCINNPMDTQNVELREKNFRSDYKEYIYIGMINENKGIYNFLEVYKEFSKDKNVKLKIIGKCTSNLDEEKIKKYLEENSKIEFLGYKKHEDTINELEKADFIVVPSLWVENYPTTTLEGMLYGVVVLGSNRGGIPEMVGSDRGILFNILDKKDILTKLNDSYHITEQEYFSIQKKAYEYVMDNNSYDTYYKRLMEVLK